MTFLYKNMTTRDLQKSAPIVLKKVSARKFFSQAEFSYENVGVSSAK